MRDRIPWIVKRFDTYTINIILLSIAIPIYEITLCGYACVIHIGTYYNTLHSADYDTT